VAYLYVQTAPTTAPGSLWTRAATFRRRFSAASWLGDGDAQPEHANSGMCGNRDLVVQKHDPNGDFKRHTVYGAGDAHDNGLGIALDANYGVLVTGLSVATWQGDGGAKPLHAHSGNLTGDSFVLKLYDRIYPLLAVGHAVVGAYHPFLITHFPLPTLLKKEKVSRKGAKAQDF
jgi:hypothetical protein